MNSKVGEILLIAAWTTVPAYSKNTTQTEHNWIVPVAVVKNNTDLISVF